MLSEIVNPLLIRPNPELYESWRGYILRVAEENVLVSPRIMLRYSKVSKENLRTTFPHIKNMVALTKKEKKILNQIYPVNHKKNTYKILGQTIPKSYLRVNTPMVCTECVKQLGYIPARWDVMYMNVCHIHKRELLSHCPSCKNKLSWYRQGLLKCQCGYDFSESIGPKANENEINFSECLSIVIEKKGHKAAYPNNPIQESFFNLKINTLLGIFNSIGLQKLNVIGSKKLIQPTGSQEVYEQAIKVLNNWQTEFKELIRQNEVNNLTQETSVRKRHENLYGSFFKKGYPESEIGFLREDFITHAQSLGDTVFVDNRIKRKVTSKKIKINNIGIYDASKELGIMPSTLRNKLRKGIVKAQEVKTGNGRVRYFFDTETLENKLPNEKGELHLRAAAAYVDLPVSVIKSLRDTNHINSNYKTVYPTTWAIPDLDLFKKRIMDTVEESISFSDSISISKVMLMKLSHDDLKAEIIRGVLDGQVKTVGYSDNIGKVIVSKSEALNFADLKRLESAEYLMFKDVTKMTGIDLSCLNYIHKSQIFRTKKVKNTTYVNRKDVENFNKEFVAISRVAAMHEFSAQKLTSKAELLGIELRCFERNSGKRQSFIKRGNQKMLLQSYFL